MEIKYRRELVNLMRELNLPLIAAECGVAEGLHSKDLLLAGIEKLYLIDVWQSMPNLIGDASNWQNFHDRNYLLAMDFIKGYEHKTVVLKGLTSEMAKRVPDNSLGMCYLDASHDYLSVLQDLELYLPKIVDGGIMAGHDFLNVWDYGVNQAVIEFAAARNYEVHTIPEDKEEDAGFYFIKK